MREPMKVLLELMDEYGDDFYKPLDGRDTPIEELEAVLKKAEAELNKLPSNYSSVKTMRLMWQNANYGLNIRKKYERHLNAKTRT